MDTQTPASIVTKEGKEIDPSILTTQQLWREIASLKELVLTHIERVDKAVDVAHADLVRVPTEVQKAISGLKDVHEEKFTTFEHRFSDRAKFIDQRLDDNYRIADEKFNSVEKQFKERDTRVEQTARDTKLAVDAALQAAEKAVSKSETSTVKQIDQQALTITNANRSLDDKINDLKDRITRIEGQALGALSQKGETKDNWGYIAGGVGLLITIITIVIAFMKYKT